jgi:peptide/nickel transport system permease protein
MLEALRSEFVKFARTKGVPEGTILWRHAFRNALLGVITLGSLLLPALLTGSVIIETVFSWPGMGQLLISAVRAHDYPVVQLIVLVISAFYIVTNLATDVAYSFIDPRVRLAQ